jgi:hypothetical protein
MLFMRVWHFFVMIVAFLRALICCYFLQLSLSRLRARYYVKRFWIISFESYDKENIRDKLGIKIIFSEYLGENCREINN